jgi:hypothetical protein
MKTLFTGVLLAAFATVALTGCDKGGDKAEGGDKKEGSSGDSIGIKECDDYIAKMSKCLDNMDDAAKGPAKDALEQSKKAWAEAAKGPGKDTLKTTCAEIAKTLDANPACK